MTRKTRIKKYNICINLRYPRYPRQKNNFRVLSFCGYKSICVNKLINLNSA